MADPFAHRRSHGQSGRARGVIDPRPAVPPGRGEFARPRVSILIPNFNNGRASSASGTHDFLGRLLDSLVATLADDPTPFEVLAHDDGSTDDSRATLEHWANERTWPNDDRPFFAHCRLAEHVGVLSIVSNDLCRRARGDILVRLDGDITCLTPRWVSRLVDLFDAAGPDLGVIGPKQLGVDGRVHAFGDAVLHRRGYHHIGSGALRDAFDDRFPDGLEVDHVMGAFYCVRRAVYDALGGFDEQMGRGQTIDFGLRARLEGFRTIVTPAFEFEHAHKLRFNRATGADDRASKLDALRRFETKWGFSRLVPDLERVRTLYAGTPLLWHEGLRQGPTTPHPLHRRHRALDADLLPQSEWARYAGGDMTIRRATDWKVALGLDLHRQAGPRRNVAEIGCGEGLAGALLARQTGARYTGIDIDARAIEVGRLFVGGSSAAGADPSTTTRSVSLVALDEPTGTPSASGDPWPLPAHSIDLLILNGQFGGSGVRANPAALLREAVRVVAPGGFLLIVEPTAAPHAAASASRGSTSETPADPWFWWREPTVWSRESLTATVVGFGGFALCGGPAAELARSPDGAWCAAVFARVAELRPELAGETGRRHGPLSVLAGAGEVVVTSRGSRVRCSGTGVRGNSHPGRVHLRIGSHGPLIERSPGVV